MINTVIFDMDGVILDSEPLHSLSLERAIKAYGKVPIYNDQGVIHEVGSSGNESAVRILSDHEIDDTLESFRGKRRKIFEEIIREKLVPLPGVIDLLKVLEKENYKIGLASNRFLDHIIIIVENLGLKEYFDVIVGPSDTRRPKPDPDIYLDTASELNVLPKECVAIEDSETGVKAAVAAGMKVIAVPNKFTAHQDFSKASKIVKSLHEIHINMLKKI